MELQEAIRNLKIKRSPKAILLSTVAPFLKDNEILLSLARVRINSMTDRDVELAKQVILKCAEELRS